MNMFSPLMVTSQSNLFRLRYSFLIISSAHGILLQMPWHRLVYGLHKHGQVLFEQSGVYDMQYSTTFGIGLGVTGEIAANEDWKPGLI